MASLVNSGHKLRMNQLLASHREKLLQRIDAIPAFQTLQVRILTMEHGYCEAIVPQGTALNGIFDTYHGGMLATAADTIACFSLLTVINPEERVTTTDLHIRYLAPCVTDARVVARPIKVGKSLCPIQVDLYDMHDTHVATAQVTYIRLTERKS